MRILILSLILLITVLIEATFITLPLSLLLLANFLVLEKKPWVFTAAFFSGLVLDILLLRFLGSTSLYFVIFLYIMYLYERKFETANLYFILFASFIGCFVYLTVFHVRLAFTQSVAAAFLGVAIFFVIKIFPKRKNIDYHSKLERQ